MLKWPNVSRRYSVSDANEEIVLLITYAHVPYGFNTRVEWNCASRHDLPSVLTAVEKQISEDRRISFTRCASRSEIVIVCARKQDVARLSYFSTFEARCRSGCGKFFFLFFFFLSPISQLSAPSVRWFKQQTSRISNYSRVHALFSGNG